MLVKGATADMQQNRAWDTADTSAYCYILRSKHQRSHASEFKRKSHWVPFERILLSGTWADENNQLIKV